MKKIIFIVPYYGKVPDYFDIWLKSAEYNNEIDFLFVSDLDLNNILPENVHQLKLSFLDLKELIQSKFDFKIELDSPYNLCDFKPAYGDIFSQYIKDYDFWGNCDTDQIFGNIFSFLSEQILDKYERILYLGHFSLYKNDELMKTFYKLPGALFDYKKVYSTKEWYSFGEVSGTLQITLKNNISLYSEIIYVDTISAYSQLKFYGDKENPDHFVFYWEDGHVYRAYVKDGKIYSDEWMYIHLQKRKMKDKRSNQNRGFYILGDSFIDKDNPGIPSLEEIYRYSGYKGECFLKKERRVYFKKQIQKFLKKSLREKYIWIRQRLARRKMLWPENALYK